MTVSLFKFLKTYCAWSDRSQVCHVLDITVEEYTELCKQIRKHIKLPQPHRCSSWDFDRLCAQLRAAIPDQYNPYE